MPSTRIYLRSTLAALTLAAVAAATLAWGIDPHFKTGFVYTRALVLGPHGAPIWAEFILSGGNPPELTTLDVIGEAVDPPLGPKRLGSATVMPGEVYRAHVAAYECPVRMSAMYFFIRPQHFFCRRRHQKQHPQ